MQKVTVLCLFLWFIQGVSFSQNISISEKDTLIRNIVEQIVLFPKEKIYLHTDKQLYISGEKIWFRAYLVDAVLHKPVINQYVYIELLNPYDSVVSRVKIRQTDGAYAGFIPLEQRIPEGDYTLCAWSDNMVNIGPAYFFKKRIHISNLLSNTIGINASFKFGKDNQVTSELHFEDPESHRVIRPDGLRISLNDLPVNLSKTGIYDAAYFSFKLPESKKNNALYVETKKSRKYIPLIFQDNDFDVSFYPEGGYLLEGVRCKIAFKALGSNGMSENMKGIVYDGKGNEYTQISTIHDGMGSFYLVPSSGQGYYTICKNELGKEKRFDLPQGQKGMYAIKAENRGSQILISVLHSSDIIMKNDLFLVLHTRGMVHYASGWDENFTSLAFDEQKFPSGILQIILLDARMNPLSERLVFLINNDQANIEIKTDLQEYKARQKVLASAKVTDSKGFPLGGTFSLSVTDDNDVKPDSVSDILSCLLLTSELKGNINNPAYYFKNRNPETIRALDLLMLTNGWRRYNIPAVAAGNYEKPVIPLKTGMEIKGTVKKLILGKPVAKSRVVIFSWAAGYFDETETKSDGRFNFNGIEFQDSMKFIIQALNKKGSDRVELFVDVDSFPKVTGLPAYFTNPDTKETEDKQLINYLAKADKKFMIENGARVINLPEVLVTARAKEKEEYNFSYYMPKSSSDVMTSNQIGTYHPSRVSEILNHFPGVRTQEDENGKLKAIIERMSLRMTGPQYNFASLIIDDMRIEDYDIDNEIDPSDIERIGVLKGSQAILLGGEGSGGAIVITTKRGAFVKDSSPKFNIKIFNPLGYQKPVEFYSPKYDTPEQKSRWDPDMRTTIYWNPNVPVSSTGEASFAFYTADASTTYTMIIEGISNEGSIIRTVKKISRK